MEDTEIAIRPLRALSEMRAAVELQQSYWGDDLESIVPAHMLFSLASYGGHVLAAFDGARMVGVLIGFLGTDEDYTRPAVGNLQIASKRMVVLPEYRNRGLAYRLKLAQRDLAIGQEVRLVTWTFDPLLAPNANLNIRKLGAICQKFRENYYGTEDAGGLAVMGTSDRLFVEWWVTSKRVKERLQGQSDDLTFAQHLERGVRVVNPAVFSSSLPEPAVHTQDVVGTHALLEIPQDMGAISRGDPSLALSWRLHIRDQLQLFTRAGYAVTDFLRASYQGLDRVFYLLSRDPRFDFSHN